MAEQKCPKCDSTNVMVENGRGACISCGLFWYLRDQDEIEDLLLLAMTGGDYDE